MATSDRGAAARFLGYLESRKNLAGCAAGLLGLGLTFAGVAGAYWPVVVAGLYGAAALIAPPERPAAPDFPDPGEQLEVLRGDLDRLRAYLDEAALPASAGPGTRQLTETLGALLQPGWVAEELSGDPEAVHVLSRAIRQDVPEAVNAYVRTRWWNRLGPGGEPPERHLERQLALLAEEITAIAEALREAESLRQETHTRYLEDRRPPG